MPYKDPEKQRAYNRKWYAENPDKQKRAVKNRQRALRQRFTDYKKTKPCLHCGETDPVCIEFHHIDPRTKDTEPSQMINNKGWSFERVVEHLEKCCIPLCSNCHKKVHRDLRELEKKMSRKPPAQKRKSTA